MPLCVFLSASSSVGGNWIVSLLLLARTLLFPLRPKSSSGGIDLYQGRTASCLNAAVIGLNTLLLSLSNTPVPEIVALAACACRKRQDFRLERCPRTETDLRPGPNNEPDKISHPATASPDFRSTASQIEFATVTGSRPAPDRGARASRPIFCRLNAYELILNFTRSARRDSSPL
jgi:hypothetical protein